MKPNRPSILAIIAIILISLALGCYLGVRPREAPRTDPVKPSEMEAVPVKPAPAAPTPPPPAKTGGKDGEKERLKPYRVGGMGSKNGIPVDLPDQSTDIPEEKPEEGRSIRLPEELQDLSDGVKEQIDAFDEATRKSVKSALDALDLEEFEPDEATIRPKGDGLELRFSIPIGD